MRKFALAAHLCSSIGWIGAAVVYAPLVVAVLSSSDQRVVRDAILLMSSIERFVILPLACLTLGTGLVVSLGTQWGLLRHWWALFSVLLTAAVFVLTEYSLTLGSMAAVAAQATARRRTWPC